jgi:hypothetical protein
MVNKALLVGINYLNTPYELNGCINDVLFVKDHLIQDMHFKNENILVLRDNDPKNMPTYGNILEKLNNLINNSSQRDNIYIHFSGHGTYVEDQNNDEKDGKDEVFVPVNYEQGFISDDVLFSIVSKTNTNVLMVFDCCHSGSLCDLPYKYDNINNEIKLSMENTRALNKKVTMISGCRDEQSSFDFFSEKQNKHHGLLTLRLYEYLKQTNYSLTFKELIKNIHKRTDLGGDFKQNPNVSACYSGFLDHHIFNSEDYVEPEVLEQEKEEQKQELQQQELQNQKEENNNLQEQLNKLKNQLQQKQQELQQKQQELQQKQQEVNNKQKVIESKQQQVNKLQNEVNYIRRRYTQLANYTNKILRILRSRR